MFKIIRDQKIEAKSKEIALIEDTIDENHENPEAVKDLEAKRKLEIKE